jgi:hypothetical protein
LSIKKLLLLDMSDNGLAPVNKLEANPVPNQQVLMNTSLCRDNTMILGVKISPLGEAA